MPVVVRISTANLRTFVTISGIDSKSPEKTLLMRAIQDVWRLNVKRFFSQSELHYPRRKNAGKHTGAGIETLFHCSILKGDIIGTIDTSDAAYIRYLIHGLPPSKGAYVPSLGGRVETGRYRGLPTIYWTTWQSFFKNEVLALVEQFDISDTHKHNEPRNYDDLKAARIQEVTKVRNIVAAGRLLL